ncbi:MAG: ABC transporter ATP-binding protein [Actinomycetaceae bacterium]|nr:ABC transporter ATP-binding protein [Actinomycetaceae bacterium]
MSDLSTRPEIITVDNVTKRFTVRKDKSLKERIVNMGRSAKHAERFTALDNVSFTVKAGESIGLIGANGSGKSTMLKMIGGILSPDSGSVHVRGRIAALLELGTGFHPDLTGRENIYLNASMLGLTDEEINNSIDDIIAFSGIANFIDTQVKFYSSGMYVRLAFAVAVHSDPDILLVDEVLAVGDEPFQQKCMDKIKQFQKEGRSIILVSHSPSHIIDICDKAIILNHGKVVGIEEPKRAIELLHSMYSEQAENDLSNLEGVRSRFIPPENPDCTIDAVRLIGDFANTGIGFESGSTLDIAFDISSSKRLEDYTFMFELRDTHQQFVWGTASWNIDAQLEPIDGSNTIVLTIPDFALGAGTYFGNLVIRDEKGNNLARADEAVELIVRSGAASNGLVYAIPHARTR